MKSPLPINLRDQLYAFFLASIAEKNPAAVFEAKARGLSMDLDAKANPEYWKDRIPRFERVTKKMPNLLSIPIELERDLRIGEALFNEGLFFDCHEYLEGAWNRSAGEEKIMLQGIIQAAAGFHKLELGSPDGCFELLGKSVEKLSAIRDRRREPLLKFAASLDRLKKEVLNGDFDLSQTPRLDTTIL
jgi:predicted metal-dependent hydrolase